MDEHIEEQPTSVEPQAPLEYRQLLNYSQGLRKQVADELIKSGIPTDKDNVDMLLKTLKDMDSTAINDRKNEIDQQTADGAKEVNQSMVKMLERLQNRNPFQRTADGSVAAVSEAVLPSVDPERLGEHDLVHGEGEIGVLNETSSDFMKRMEDGRKHDE